MTLFAIPANESAHTYSGSGPDPVFDATDRDTVCCGASAPFGLGVMNTLISNGQPGVTSKPSEIGFYQNPAICGDGKPLGNHCSDALHVNLDQAVTGGNVKVAFFYGSEQAGETLQVELYNNGIMVAGATQGPAGNGAYGGGNPGFYTFPLGDVCWDEIRFLGDNANVADATDYLVEGIADLSVCEVTVPPEVSFTQGFFGSSPVGEALVAGLINDDNCADINTILTSIGALEAALDCVVPAEATASALAHFLTGQVGAGKERAPDIGFLPSGFEPGDNLAAQKITLLINMELEAGINTGNFLNIGVVNGIDPLLTTGGQLGACDDLLPLDPLGPDGICDAGTVVGVWERGRFEPARAEMARLDGIHLCPEGAATMVAYGKALKRGLIAAGDRAVLFNCASGLKYAMPPVAARLDRHQPIDYAAILGAPLTA